ncbi:MAG: outer membrane protein assembly factor BamD [Fidelibacterota bacterium]
MRKGIPFLLMAGLLFHMACSRSRVEVKEDDLQQRFDRGMEFFEKKKYFRAQDEFEYVLVRGRHTELGDDAQFYLAESYFRNKEYLLAIGEYDRLIRQMTYSPYVEESRYRICQGYARLSPKYFHDQEYTVKAIDKLQEFVEDFPGSKYRAEAVDTIRSLRTKLARKEFEAAILYIKMEEYPSAIQYLRDLLDTYYDTDYADQARLKIVEAYLKRGEIDKAEEFLNQNESKFRDSDMLKDARDLILSDKAKRGENEKS